MLLEEAELADEREYEAAQRYEKCVFRAACDHAADMHTVEETHVWLRCHECEVYEDEHCPMLLSGMMRCKGAGND